MKTTENARLRAALKECIAALKLPVEPLPRVDPDYGEAVKQLGDRIGYGAMMTSASASWRTYLAARGYPVGGEFVAGPCTATIQRALKIARDALKKAKGARR